ncbi:separase [Trypanosoma grayi]|uniref:separase n=1 Tax=Trypanosoma grayi TaxID=71804 RepID=UPI0004F463C8|nr:separase [Trypanosoma grayi]KEG13586.1 separase [Trypanosoma grayi]
MEPVTGGGILLHKAKCPLTDEAELQAVLADAKAAAAVGGVWHTVRLLASRARSTLQSGRGDLALPLVTTAIDLCPEPYRRLALLHSEDSVQGGCALAQSMVATPDWQYRDRDAIAVVCTAMVVWHGAVASTADVSSCPHRFLRFSHRVGHVLTAVMTDAENLHSLSACWLYNTLAFAHRSKKTQEVAFYLLEELRDEASPSDLVDVSEWRLVCCTGGNACVREGLRGTQVAAVWQRLCATLYAEGCALLHASQEKVCRRAADAMDVLRRSLTGEPTHYVTDVRRPLSLDPREAVFLHDSAASADLCVPREAFAPLRVACFLRCVAGRNTCGSSVNYPLASVAGAVALAYRHRHGDIAEEILRAGLTDGTGEGSLVAWGEELESILDGLMLPPGGGFGSTELAKRCRGVARRRLGEPEPLLHAAVQEWRAADVLRVLALSHTLEELLPAGVAVLRGDATVGRRLLGDIIAPSLVLDGLVRLILRLVDEGDAPLARCFLPLVAGICVRMPSQANLLVTLQAVAAFARCCLDFSSRQLEGVQRWEGVAKALLPLLPPRCSALGPPYRQTKATVVGRTFAARRRVFGALRGGVPTEGNASRCCQLQVLLAGEGKEGVRLLRRSGVDGVSQWEKVLPIEEVLLKMVDRTREIELQNRRHLNALPRKEDASLLGDGHSGAEKTPCNGDSGADCGGEATEQDSKERADWWEQRHALDRALREVVEVLQSDEAFGCWRLSMCGDLSPTCMLELQSLAAQLLLTLHAPAHHTDDVMLMLAGLPFIGARYSLREKLLFSPSHVHLGGPCHACEEVLVKLSEALRSELLNRGIAAPSNELWDVSRDICFRALSAMCTTNEYRQQQQETQRHQEKQGSFDHVDLFELPRTHVYLALDNELHCLPFEGIDVLRTGSVSRVPTATFVSESNGRAALLGDGVAYCVIDPHGVMPKTVKRLLPVCQRGGWRVKSQSMPSGELLREVYASGARLYVYAGHGKGGCVVRPEELYERFPDPCQFPAVFLMGCSSAYMDGGSSYDCYGMPYAYLHAGCPLFVGCLWHVTDGEIDRLTKRLLLLVAGDVASGGNDCCGRHPQTIGEALAMARQACKLPFLTGCSTVLYGVNLPLRSDDGK